MGRRIREGGHPAKQRRRAARPKLRKVATGVADLREQLDRRTRELDDALQQQVATSEVLRIIRLSPADAQPVFDAIVQSASRLCGAIFGVVYLYDGDRLRIAATNNFTPAATVHLNEMQQLRRPERSHLGGRAILDRKIVHVPDVLEDSEYSHELALAGGWRAVLAVPLLREGIPIGALTAAKAEAAPFSDRQIQLLKTFADQAVIAIENTRLLNELRESLQQQTATADVLKLISRSTFDLQTVLNTLTESAARLCEADKGAIMMRDGDVYRIRANYGFPDEAVQYALNNPLQPGRGSATGRAALEGRAINIPDALADPEYRAAGYHKAFGYRSMLAIPLLREGTAIGTFTLTRDEVNPFTEKQKELATTFADQAVIAIENARLFDEVQARTRDLSELLRQQTATADVLKVISRSTFDLQTVLDTLVELAVRLCEAERGLLFRRDGEIYKSVAYYNYSREFREFHESHPITPGRGTTVGRMALEGKAVQIVDLLSDPEYTFTEAQKLGQGRAILAVPLLREANPVGALALQRNEPRAYSGKQIELVETFADQAVIALENARLLNELRESLQQQTATADVLKVISRSTFDLQTVLQTLVESAARLCDADQDHHYPPEKRSFLPC